MGRLDISQIALSAGFKKDIDYGIDCESGRSWFRDDKTANEIAMLIQQRKD